MKSWKTTFAGIALMGLSGWTAVKHPEKATDPQTVATLVTGAGLLASKDHDVTGGKRKQEPKRE